MSDPTVLAVPSNGVNLTAYRWDPDTQPRAIVQIVHGMGEHARRYAPLATELAGRGYVVYAYDHRGHGDSLAAGAEPGELGAGGWSELVRDIGRVADVARAEYPDLKLALVAHSMGSFATEQFLLNDGSRVAAVALTGTAAIDLLEPALDLDAPLDLAMFNAAFQPARTDYDWLSRDEAEVDKYVADPLCGFGVDIVGAKDMFVGSRQLADPARVSQMRPDLPVYIAVGDMDPVNGQLALINPLADRYREAGLADVTLRVYPGARHEVLNETNRDEIVADLTAWLDRALG